MTCTSAVVMWFTRRAKCVQVTQTTENPLWKIVIRVGPFPLKGILNMVKR